MRITNKIIQNNSLSNINTNKLLQDKLSTQISTSKKLERPSDDPIVALRSLRLRTSVNQTDQFLNKNVQDAASWLQVTEDAIGTLSDIITDMRKQYVKGTSDNLTVADRQIIIENLTSLAAEVYNTGNVDFAGRSVFTGYRTNSTLTFEQSEDISYTIWEDFEWEDMDSITYVTEPDYSSDTAVEQDVRSDSIKRYRLSYNALDETKIPSLTIKSTDVSVTGGTAVDSDGDGVNDATTVTPLVVSETDEPDPYTLALNDKNAVILVPETGELLFGENVAASLSDTDIEMEISYDKTSWNKGELKPEHYFKCKNNDESIEYNYDSSPEGEICYNIGVNQNLRINTTASECFTHNITRDIDDIINCLNEVDEIENTISTLESEYDAIPETDTAQRTIKQNQIDAAKKAETYLNGKLSAMMGEGITKADGYLDQNNIALTNVGTRSKRLELIENRLSTQLSTLTELKSDNEDVDIAETAIKLSSAEYAYEASLMATSKIIKESLLSYL